MILTSVTALSQQARTSSSRELLALCDILVEVLPKIRARVGVDDREMPQAAAFQCERATKEVVADLKRQDFDAVRLAGFIPQGPKDWLEHEVALVRLENHWLTIDLAVAQIFRFRGEPLVILLCDPAWNSLEAALRDAYSWWLPGQETPSEEK